MELGFESELNNTLNVMCITNASSATHVCYMTTVKAGIREIKIFLDPRLIQG